MVAQSREVDFPSSMTEEQKIESSGFKRLTVFYANDPGRGKDIDIPPSMIDRQRELIREAISEAQVDEPVRDSAWSTAPLFTPYKPKPGAAFAGFI